MIKKIKNFICKIFNIKSCKCNETDPHEELILHVPKPIIKLEHCPSHLRFKKSCPLCQEVVA